MNLAFVSSVTAAATPANRLIDLSNRFIASRSPTGKSAEYRNEPENQNKISQIHRKNGEKEKYYGFLYDATV